MKNRKRSSEGGYSLIEMMMVTGLIAVVGGMAAIQMQQTRNYVRGDAPMRVIQAQLSQAREQAITQRRYMRITFNTTTSEVSIVREDTVATTTTLATIPFEVGTFSLVAGVPDTPEAFGNATATSFTSSNGTFASATGTTTIAKFAPDGTLVDWNGAATNGTVFTSASGAAASARAVTILGSTGRVRSYRWNGSAWVKV
jgi:Tfp pilus assembly protein FimT